MATDEFLPDDYDREEGLKSVSDSFLNYIKETYEVEDESDIMLFSFLMEEDEATYIQNQFYHALPDEHMATDWAINWLQNAENRKLAKAFEKKFFACFRR